MVPNRLKKILCLILFLSLISPVFATDLNWSLTGTESENLIAGTGSGNVSSINDNNTTTYREVGEGSIGSPGGITFEHEIAFTESVNTINKVEIVSEAATAGGGMLDYDVYLYYNSQWNLVYEGPSLPSVWVKTTHSQTGTWSNVTKIKVYWSGGFPGAHGAFILLRDYELRAWGPLNYSDIGLRVRAGASTLKIGTQALDGHALRIKKGGTTYGIPLIATSDASACGIRIYDGANVKSVPEVT